MKTKYLICFDIVDNKNRYRTVKHLKRFGCRVQKSVFECILSKDEFVELKNLLDKEVVKDADSIRYYFLCKNCAGNFLQSGKGIIFEERDILVI